MTKICKVEGCDRKVRARDMCNMHWKRWRKATPDMVPRKHDRHSPTCTIGGCNEPYVAKGRCHKHYMQMYRKSFMSPEQKRRENASKRGWERKHPEKHAAQRARAETRRQQKRRDNLAQRLAKYADPPIGN